MVEKQLAQSEANLVAACKRGERKAQFELYQRYAKAMLNTAWRIVGDEDAARDVLQEAFVKVFGKLEAWRGESTIGVWIKQIVIREAINFLRKRKVEWAELPHDLAIAPEAAHHAEEEALQADAQQALRVLQSLPDGYRTVLTLYLVEGYDHAEIAEILGIELSTSLSQFSRGRKKLQQLLTHLQYHG